MNTRRKQTALLAVATTLSGLLVSVAATDRAGADPKVGSGALADAATIAMMAKQTKLDRLADRIEASSPESAETGVSGFYVEAKKNTLKVYWKGAVPAAAAKEIELARAQGMTVEVSAAPYTLVELRAEVKRLAGLNMSGAQASGPRLVSVGPKHDGSGIQLGVAGLPGEVSAAQALAALPSLAGSVAVEAFPDEPAVKADRLVDSAPFYGGGYIERRVNGVAQNSCSSGFAAQAGGLSFMLTAAHCGHGEWWTGRRSGTNGNVLGTSALRQDRAHDAMLIVASSSPLMFDGGSIAGERGQFTKTVSGVSTTRAGDYVCISGSYSGAICPLLATRTGLTIQVGGFGEVTDVVHADRESTPRKAAGGNGDSGGPVFSLDGSDKVIARGTYSAYPGNSALWDACEGVPGEGQPNGQTGRHCSHRIYYPDIMAQMRGLEFTVKTG